MLNITYYQRNVNQNHSGRITLVRMARIKKSTNNKCWRGCGEQYEDSFELMLSNCGAGEGVEKRGLSYTVGGNANSYSHYGEQCGDSLKNWK